MPLGAVENERLRRGLWDVFPRRPEFVVVDFTAFGGRKFVAQVIREPRTGRAPVLARAVPEGARLVSGGRVPASIGGAQEREPSVPRGLVERPPAPAGLPRPERPPTVREAMTGTGVGFAFTNTLTAGETSSEAVLESLPFPGVISEVEVTWTGGIAAASWNLIVEGMGDVVTGVRDADSLNTPPASSFTVSADNKHQLFPGFFVRDAGRRLIFRVQREAGAAGATVALCNVSYNEVDMRRLRKVEEVARLPFEDVIRDLRSRPQALRRSAGPPSSARPRASVQRLRNPARPQEGFASEEIQTGVILHGIWFNTQDEGPVRMPLPVTEWSPEQFERAIALELKSPTVDIVTREGFRTVPGMLGVARVAF